MISNKQLEVKLRENFERRLDLTKRKNRNYAGGDDDSNAFKNFDLVEVLSNGKVTREMGLFVRMTDKLARLGTLMFGGNDLVGEFVPETLDDLGNYADLAKIAWEDTMEKKHALDGAEQTSFDFSGFDCSADIPVVVVNEPGPQLDNLVHYYPEEITEPVEETPKSKLSRFFEKMKLDRTSAA